MKFQDVLWVRNNGNDTFADKFDGDEFELKPGQVLQIHQGCAELCFGFGKDPADKLPTLRRLGWAHTNVDMVAGLKRLNAFSFHESEKAANDHRIKKATAPPNGASVTETEGASAPSESSPTNLLAKVAAVAQTAA